MKDLTKRSIAAIVFAGILSGLVYYSFYSFLLLLLIIVLGGVYEMYKLFETAKLFIDRNYLWIKVSVSILFILYLCFALEHNTWNNKLYVFVFLSICLFIEFLLRENFSEAISEFLITIYFTTFFIAALDIFYFYHKQNYEYIYPLSIIFMIWANDTFAYFTGSLLGKHKLIPEVSPKKSVEGFIGGIIFSVITALLCFQYFISDSGRWTLIDMIVVAIIVSIFGTLGDLVESKLKRLAKVKDSGNIMPGHGGILDRFDAWYIAIPTIDMYFLLRSIW